MATGWDPTTRTLPWAPLAQWNGSTVVDDVDASKVSMSDIIDKYISIGRPVVIKGGLRQCTDAMKLWGKEALKQSQLADVMYKAYRCAMWFVALGIASSIESMMALWLDRIGTEISATGLCVFCLFVVGKRVCQSHFQNLWTNTCPLASSPTTQSRDTSWRRRGSKSWKKN